MKAAVDDRQRNSTTAHYVNLWLRSSGSFFLGKRYDSAEAARGINPPPDDKDAKRICTLKVTTIVEVASDESAT